MFWFTYKIDETNKHTCEYLYPVQEKAFISARKIVDNVWKEKLSK